MANTTKKTTKPKTESTVEKTTNVKTEPVVEKAPKQFAPTDEIECRSITAGELILVGPKTKLQYTWSEYGDIAYVEFQDLRALQSLKSNFLIKPRFIIQDDDVVELWKDMLMPIYDKINTETIEDLFELPIDRFQVVLENLPVGMKDTVKTMAVKMIQSEELYDVRKVRILDEVLGTDFVEMYLK